MNEVLTIKPNCKKFFLVTTSFGLLLSRLLFFGSKPVSDGVMVALITLILTTGLSFKILPSRIVTVDEDGVRGYWQNSKHTMSWSGIGFRKINFEHIDLDSSGHHMPGFIPGTTIYNIEDLALFLPSLLYSKEDRAKLLEEIEKNIERG
jgi:hypothetical protein